MTVPCCSQRLIACGSVDVAERCRRCHQVSDFAVLVPVRLPEIEAQLAAYRVAASRLPALPQTPAALGSGQL